jgi:hypothetical protein
MASRIILSVSSTVRPVATGTNILLLLRLPYQAKLSYREGICGEHR